MSFLDSLTGGGGGEDPSKAAQQYLSQIPGTITPYYQPYINAGQGAMGDLQSQYRQLLSNPTAIMNMIGSQYHASPGYQFNVNEATRGANNAAQAGGMVGSPQEQQQLSQTISGIANQDYNNFLNQGLGLYGQGLGVAGNINQMGYGASNELANSLGSLLQTEAQNAYQGADYRNRQNQGGFGNLLGLAGSIGGMFMGGPAGGMIGGSIGNMFGGGGGGGGGGGMSWGDLQNYLPSSDFNARSAGENW